MIYLWLAILAAFLAALSIIDMRTFRLPDILTFSLTGLGLAQAYNLGLSIAASFIGAIAGYLLLWTVEYLYRRLRGRDGIGRGDAKLLGAGGAWVGWMGLPYILLIASFSGLIYALLLSARSKDMSATSIVPFGPALSLGIFVSWLSMRTVEGYFS